MAGKKILITGGAGYIGKCLAFECEQRGLTPILVDNFLASRREAVPARWKILEADLAEPGTLDSALREAEGVAAVFHLAALALVPESVDKPELYFRNNLGAALGIAEWAVKHRIPTLVHSSSCAVYGVPENLPISENAPLKPVSPYGESKWLAERLLDGLAAARGLKLAHLRYFNPVGSVGGGQFGESHLPETHLIPCVIKALRDGQTVSIFGNQQPTRDGTCVRDFIHIADLVEAHLKVLEYLETQSRLDSPLILNLGTGKGISVAEVFQTACSVLGVKGESKMFPGRPGDPAELVADAGAAERLLGWKATRSIEDMIRDHLLYEQAQQSAILR